MGTPDFAVPALKALAGYDCDIPLVVTQPDRPKGRGKKMVAPPVKTAAEKLGLKVLQPKSMKDQYVKDKLASIHPDLFVVAAFGHILPKEILAIPAIFPINIHASLLPAHRGSSPIQSALLSLDKKAGVTTMVMDQGLDTGDMLLRSSVNLTFKETAEDLHDTLSILGADLIIKTLDALSENRLTPAAQDAGQASYAPMLKKSDGNINWTVEPVKIDALIRAMTPWPGAYTFFKDRRLKLFKIKNGGSDPGLEPGTVFRCDKEGIHVAAQEGSVVILELQGASGKRLTADAFLRGSPIPVGTRLTQDSQNP